MARTKQFDERQVLLAAMLVFWEKGYEGTSILDLEQATGLGRTSIYNTFGNKRALFEQVLACYKESVMASLFTAMDSVPDIREGISRLLITALDVNYDEQYPGGCLVVLSVLESGQHDAASRASLEQSMRELRQGLQQRITRARKRGELPASLDAAATATTIATVMAGMMVMGKANFPRTTLKKAIHQVLALLD
ncbi:MAG TPA: TetR/AcrR family transcriptional regulator [Gammaproteobacteria bacterium]|nr:TetR/AcrR family transcriptional regulator [Gammaproteobacteria bacterium]